MNILASIKKNQLVSSIEFLVTREVLLIGGSGFLGKQLTSTFLLQGDNLTVYHRQYDPMQCHSNEVRHYHADRTRIHDFLFDKTFDLIIDLCAYETEDLLESLKLKFQHYIFLSSVAVYSNSISFGAEEDAQLMNENLVSNSILSELELKHYKYSLKKLLCERYLNLVADHCSIVRPPYILGRFESSGRLNNLYNLGNNGQEILIPTSQTRRFQFIDVRDLSTLIFQISNRIPGQIYNTVGPSLTWEEFVCTFTEVFGKKNWISSKVDDFPFWDLEPNIGKRSLRSKHDFINQFPFVTLNESLEDFKRHAFL